MSAMVQASTMRARPARKSENPKNLGAFESSGTKQTRTTHCSTITRLPLYTHRAADYSTSPIIHEKAPPWQHRVRVRAPALDAGANSGILDGRYQPNSLIDPPGPRVPLASET